jgi:putative phage-type endonuclease
MLTYMSIIRVKTKSHEEWLQLRSRYIGGSDAAAVVGMNPYSSPYALWAEKTGKTAGFAGNLATEVGTYLEEFVAQKFATETGKKVRKCNHSFLNSKYPFAIANIDREIVGEDAGLEIKTTNSLNLKKFKNGEYPANYYCQCVHYMAVTGKKRWYLAVLSGNNEFKWFVIERDEAEIAALMGAEADFWEFVKNDTPPAVDGSKATAETLTTIYAESNEDVVDLMMYKKDLAAYADLGRAIKKLQAQQDEVANRLKAYMGEAAKGYCDGFNVSWASTSRKSFDSKRFAKDNPHIDLSGYYKESNYRTFKINEIKGA